MKEKLYRIIFEADTPAGKAFDLGLMVVIFISILAVMLESVDAIKAKYAYPLRVIEWVITVLFTMEYMLRLLVVKKPWNYAKSFYGIIDFLALLPTYISIFIAGQQGLIVIRGLRLLRVFRILKLSRQLNESSLIVEAMKASRHKIGIFLYAVVMIVIILGTVMYLVEGENSGFTSIPKSIYWAIVTLTTVGYGDISPDTGLGQFIASVIMIIGYAIIAVPTGIVTAEISSLSNNPVTTRACPVCMSEGHDPDALYCKHCGAEL